MSRKLTTAAEGQHETPDPDRRDERSFAGASLSQAVHAPYAHAQDAIDQNTADTFDIDMFTHRPGDKADASFMRRYDAEHLAKHPKQKSDEASGRRGHSGRREATGLFVRLGVNYRHRVGDFDASGG